MDVTAEENIKVYSDELSTFRVTLVICVFIYRRARKAVAKKPVKRRDITTVSKYDMENRRKKRSVV